MDLLLNYIDYQGIILFLAVPWRKLWSTFVMTKHLKLTIPFLSQKKIYIWLYDPEQY